MENRVSTTDARRTFSELLKGVQMGRRYLITSNGRAIARLIPPGTDERWGGGGASKTADPAESATCVEEH